jgi:hypothetical protein
MKTQEMLQKIRGFFMKTKTQKVPDPIVELLMRSLQHTREEECDCGEFLNGVDQYAEMNINGEDAARLMPLIKDHLEICHECCEEYEALLRVLEGKAA